MIRAALLDGDNGGFERKEMNWNFTNLNWRAAAWTAIILIAVRIGYQIRDGRWSPVSVLLMMDAFILLSLLGRASKKPN
jgi:hypothetical protein